MPPSWFLFALASSIFCAAALHLHQRLGGRAASTAIWVKLVAVAVAMPVLARTGLPASPQFYLCTSLAALTWCVNDVAYYRAVSDHGAALVARLTPLGIVISFVAWFGVRPGLLDHYLAEPARFAAIAATLLLAAICAIAARRCPHNAKALRSLLVVLAAGVFGTFMVKLAVSAAPDLTGVFGYVGVEGAVMLIFYASWFGIRDRRLVRDVISREGLRAGLVVGTCMTAGIVCRSFAQQRIDVPAYVTAIGMTEIAWLMLAARFAGWPDHGNKWAGLGIVFAALALAALKTG